MTFEYHKPMNSKDSKKTFTSDEISKIISKASSIQAQKKLISNTHGLDETELLAVAREAGIDKDSLLEALDSYNEPDLETSFNWVKGNSKIQHLTYIDGDVDETNWEELTHEIRKVTGGLGDMTKIGNSYEWKQVVNEIGHRHISFTSQNGKTRVQGISTWPGFKLIVNLFSGMIPFMITAIFALDAELNGLIIVLLATLAAVGGISLGRIALKSYFENQKKSLINIINSVSKKLGKPNTPLITIEEEHERDTLSNAHDPSSKVKG